MFFLQTYTVDGQPYCVLLMRGGWVLMAFHPDTGIECTRFEYDIILNIHQSRPMT